MLPGKTHHKAKKYLQLLSQTRDFCNMEYFQITNIITQEKNHQSLQKRYSSNILHHSMGNRKKSFVQSFWQTAKNLGFTAAAGRIQKHPETLLGTASRHSLQRQQVALPRKLKTNTRWFSSSTSVDSLRYNYIVEKIHQDIHFTSLLTAKDRRWEAMEGEIYRSHSTQIWKALQDTQDVTGSKRRTCSAVTTYAESCLLTTDSPA